MAFRSASPTSGYTIHTAEATLDPEKVGAGGPHVTISLGGTTAGAHSPESGLEPGSRPACLASFGQLWASLTCSEDKTEVQDRKERVCL